MNGPNHSRILCISGCFVSDIIEVQWGTEPATNPVALVSDLGIRKVVFWVVAETPREILTTVSHYQELSSHEFTT